MLALYILVLTLALSNLALTFMVFRALSRPVRVAVVGGSLLEGAEHCEAHIGPGGLLEHWNSDLEGDARLYVPALSNLAGTWVDVFIVPRSPK
jgi:hypothetical protein